MPKEKNINFKQILKEYKDETKMHFSFVAERLEKKIQIVVEQVVVNTEKIEAVQDEQQEHSQILESHSQILESHSQILAEIKYEIETIKHRMQQTVDRDEFNALEKRLTVLENKFNQALV